MPATPPVNQDLNKGEQQRSRGSDNPFARKSSEPTSDFKSNPSNPYSAPSTAPSKQVGEAGKVDLNTVFNFAWQVLTNNLGLLIGVAITLGAVSAGGNILDAVIEATNDSAVILACLAGSFVLNLISLFLGIGQVRIALKLCRGQLASYGDLFTGGDRFLHVFAWGILVAIPLVLGFLLLVIPGLFLVAIYWPAYYLIIDKKTGVFESFPAASKMGLANLGSTFLLMLASVGIMILGFMACIVGLLVAGPFVTVLWSTAYLMMTKEIRAGSGYSG